MAKPFRGAIPVDNRAKMVTIGTPEPVSVPDIEAMEANSLVADSEANPPQMPESEGPVANPSWGESPAAQAQPATPPAPSLAPQPPAAPETPANPPGVEEDPFGSKWEKMSEVERREMAKHQASMIGRQSEEIGYSRKILDMIAQGKFPVQTPTNQPKPENPDDKFLAPKLDETAKQELIALQLTDPEKHEEILYKRFQRRMAGEREQQQQMTRQQELLAEFQKVQDVVTSPQFAAWERNLPQHVIEAAKNDPNTLRWVVSQFTSAQAPAAQAPAAQPTNGNGAHRTVKIGTAAGAPASGVQQQSATGLTRTKVLKMMAEDPAQYAARHQEISELIAKGMIPGYE